MNNSDSLVCALVSGESIFIWSSGEKFLCFLGNRGLMGTSVHVRWQALGRCALRWQALGRFRRSLLTHAVFAAESVELNLANYEAFKFYAKKRSLISLSCNIYWILIKQDFVCLCSNFFSWASIFLFYSPRQKISYLNTEMLIHCFMKAIEHSAGWKHRSSHEDMRLVIRSYFELLIRSAGAGLFAYFMDVLIYISRVSTTKKNHLTVVTYNKQKL